MNAPEAELRGIAKLILYADNIVFAKCEQFFNPEVELRGIN